MRHYQNQQKERGPRKDRALGSQIRAVTAWRTHLAQVSLAGLVKLDITKVYFASVVWHLPFGFIPLKVVGGDIALTNV